MYKIRERFTGHCILDLNATPIYEGIEEAFADIGPLEESTAEMDGDILTITSEIRGNYTREDFPEYAHDNGWDPPCTEETYDFDYSEDEIKKSFVDMIKNLAGVDGTITFNLKVKAEDLLKGMKVSLSED